MTDQRTTPEWIEQGGPRELAIAWRDGHTSSFDVVDLRRACRCAACVDEWTGRQLLDPGKVSDDVRPVSIEPTGNYAIHIAWSDGHTSGIYTFDFLRSLDDAD